MKENIYDILENEDGTLTVEIKEGVTCIEEYPFMPKHFEYNDKVTALVIPSSLESVYFEYYKYFPNLKRISSKDEYHPHWGKFSFEYGTFKSEGHPKEELPCLSKNEDGTYTLNISEGVYDMSDFGSWSIYDKVSVINFPASMQEIDSYLSYHFDSLREIHFHPDSRHFIIEDGVLFSKDKKKIIKYPRNKEGESYYIDDCVEEIYAGCFDRVDHLKSIYIGKGVKKIGHRALDSDIYFCIKKVYIPKTVTEFEKEIFDEGADDGGRYYPIDVVGGVRGSAIEAYCNERNITFVEFSEDKVDEFYAMSIEDLHDLAKKQIENETEFTIDEAENGYCAKFADGTLEFFAIEKAILTDIAIKQTKLKANRERRKKVQNLIIGDGITEIADFAFDDYPNLESVWVGKDVSKIGALAFDGTDEAYIEGCPSISTIHIDPNNKWYKSIDNVIYTYDMQTLVKYAPAKPELFHEINSEVCRIGEYAFTDAKHLQCLKVGSNCVSVGKLAFLNVCSLRHVYFSSSMTHFPEHFPFVMIFGYDRPRYVPDLVIGGTDGSFVQKCCQDEGQHFHIIRDDEIDDFMLTPIPEVDRYMEDCLKVMMVDAFGCLRQVGEVGEELILPEGVKYTHYRIELENCKRLVIPSSLTSIWTGGFDGPSLCKFEVSAENPNYKTIDGHLYSLDDTLLTYSPATDNQGVLPEGTVKIDENAFSLLENPLERLYIPSTVKEIAPINRQKGFFFKAEVSPNNPYFKSVDGSIFTKDGEKIVYAKNSNEGYTIPEGTKEICENAFWGVKGTLYIPASVIKIEGNNPFDSDISTFRAPKGSYFEEYAKKGHFFFRRLEFTVDKEVVEICEPLHIDASNDGFHF